MLHHLYLGLHRQTQGGGGRTSQRSELHPGCHRNLRHRAARPRVSGAVHLLRFFHRGNLDDVQRRCHAYCRPGGQGSRAGRSSGGFPQRAASDRAVHRAHAAVADRQEYPHAAFHQRRRRSLPAASGQTLVAPGPALYQYLRPDRGHRVGHLGGACRPTSR